MSNSSAGPADSKVPYGSDYDHLSQRLASDKRTMTGAESSIVGLAPTFWTHVPLLIHDLQCNVHLLKGINCLLLNLVNEATMNYVSSLSSEGPIEPRAIKIVPISKCTLVGTIVSMERKSNGCVIYVLDDGTGLIDVVHYIEDDFLALPSLTGLSDGSPDRNAFFTPGTLVRVVGRIHCVSIVKNAESEGTDDHVQSMGRPHPGKSVIREVHASLILSIDASSNFEKEHDHWMDYARCLRDFGVHATTQQGRLPTLPILSNALDVLQVLGSDLSSQVRDSFSNNVNQPCDQSWQLFGKNCQCSNEILRRKLLYCHCIATPDVNLDPEFTYRDALLAKLLLMESEYDHTGTLHQNDDDVLKKISFDEAVNHFRFQYSEIVSNDDLNRIAFDVLRKAGSVKAVDLSSNADQQSVKASGEVRRLIRNTFRNLWKDGIIYLVDADADTYLLISRSGVLEPHVKSRMALQKLSAETRSRYFAETSRPRYLDHVPRTRLQFIRRSLSKI